MALFVLAILHDLIIFRLSILNVSTCVSIKAKSFTIFRLHTHFLARALGFDNLNQVQGVII